MPLLITLVILLLIYPIFLWWPAVLIYAGLILLWLACETIGDYL